MNRALCAHYWTSLDPCVKWTLVITGVIFTIVALNGIYLLYPFRNVSPIEISDCSAQKYEKKFPKVVHRIWLWGSPPAAHAAMMQHCDQLNPTWRTELWNESTILLFLKEHYPWSVEIYNYWSAPNSKSNLARYFIMYHHGGLYMDTDLGCHTAYEDIVDFADGANVVLAHAYPVGITTYFILNKPRHTFLKQLTENLKTSYNDGYFLPYFRALSNSGPIFMHKNFMVYPCPDQVKVIPGILDSYNTGSYFTHYGASAWHKTDGKILWMFIRMFRNFGVWNVFFCVTGCFFICIIWKQKRRHINGGLYS